MQKKSKSNSLAQLFPKKYTKNKTRKLYKQALYPDKKDKGLLKEISQAGSGHYRYLAEKAFKILPSEVIRERIFKNQHELNDFLDHNEIPEEFKCFLGSSAAFDEEEKLIEDRQMKKSLLLSFWGSEAKRSDSNEIIFSNRNSINDPIKEGKKFTSDAFSELLSNLIMSGLITQAQKSKIDQLIPFIRFINEKIESRILQFVKYIELGKEDNYYNLLRLFESGLLNIRRSSKFDDHKMYRIIIFSRFIPDVLQYRQLLGLDLQKADILNFLSTLILSRKLAIETALECTTLEDAKKLKISTELSVFIPQNAIAKLPSCVLEQGQCIVNLLKSQSLRINDPNTPEELSALTADKLNKIKLLAPLIPVFIHLRDVDNYSIDQAKLIELLHEEITNQSVTIADIIKLNLENAKKVKHLAALIKEKLIRIEQVCEYKSNEVENLKLLIGLIPSSLSIEQALAIPKGIAETINTYQLQKVLEQNSKNDYEKFMELTRKLCSVRTNVSLRDFKKIMGGIPIHFTFDQAISYSENSQFCEAFSAAQPLIELQIITFNEVARFKENDFLCYEKLSLNSLVLLSYSLQLEQFTTLLPTIIDIVANYQFDLTQLPTNYRDPVKQPMLSLFWKKDQNALQTQHKPEFKKPESVRTI